MELGLYSFAENTPDLLNNGTCSRRPSGCRICSKKSNSPISWVSISTGLASITVPTSSPLPR